MSGKMKDEPAYVEEVDEQTGKTIKRSAKKDGTKQERPSNQRRLSRRDDEDPPSDSRRAQPKSSSRLRSPIKRVELEQTSKEERRTNSDATSPKRSSSTHQTLHRHGNFAQLMEPPIRDASQFVVQYPQFYAVAQYPARSLSYHDGMSYGVYGPPPSNPACFYPALAYPPPTPVRGFLDRYSNGGSYHQSSLSALPSSYRQDCFVPPPQAPRRTLEERLDGTGRRRSLAYSNPGSDGIGYDCIEPERNDHRRPQRNSYYYVPRTPYPPSKYEDKLDSPERQQHSVGGPTVKLTAETLKRSHRRAHPTSIHGTRSRESCDGSDNLRSSVTTCTMRTAGTGAIEENVTIKLKGDRTIRIAGAEIEYKDDTELYIQRGPDVDSVVG